MTQTLVALLTIPAVAALLALALPGRWAGRVASLAMIAAFVIAARTLPAVDWRPRVVPIEFVPELGITLSLRADRLGIFFVALVTGIGAGIVRYARAYLPSGGSSTFYATLLAFTTGMLAICVGEGLATIFVGWEITTVTSALLIASQHEEAVARRGALQAFLVTGAGGLALLFGFVILAHVAGSWDLAEIAANRDAVLASRAGTAALVLVLVGAFTKSAQWPASFWLPGAMSAPAPISAFLHSATMVKAGVFLIARVHPIFSPHPLWTPILVSVGATTFVLAGIAAVRAFDLKAMLAHTTVGNLGLLVATYGWTLRGDDVALLIAIANHAIYKSALFLLVGWFEKATGSRDLHLLDREGWFAHHRVGGSLLALGAASMAGVPFLLGFAAKERFFELALDPQSPFLRPLLGAVIAALGSACFVAAAAKLVFGAVLGPDPAPVERGAPPKKISPWLLIVPGILLSTQLLFGIAPGLLSTVLDRTSAPQGIAFFHAIDRLLILSVATYATGAVAYLAWRRISALPVPPGPESAAETFVLSALRFTKWMSHAVQRGGHPRFVANVVAVAFVALAFAVLRQRSWATRWVLGPDVGLAWIPLVAIAIGAIATPILRSRAAKLLAMALAGYATALAYLFFRAPDLALTQVLVETISLVLLLLVVRRLPRLGNDERPIRKRLVHAAIAAIGGLGFGALAWIAGSTSPHDGAGAAQIAAAKLAGGRNVVNVILVDLRAADTLGEITVLAIAALGARAILSKRVEAA
jgi:NADH:ubiquinone oxidoreductase subunit 5 (subunit L)/multisubunit Na+/H+ antiporter MnhA subunit